MDFVKPLSEEERARKFKELWPELGIIHKRLTKLLARLCDEQDVYGVLGVYEMLSGMCEAATKLVGVDLIPVDEVIEEEKLEANVH